MKNLLVFSTPESAYFAGKIAQGLGAPLGKISRDRFADGELYHRIEIEGRNDLFGKTAIFVASTNTDKSFDDLEKIGFTLADYGTTRRIFVIPFFGYSTMERAVEPGEAVAAKINARRLSAIPNSDKGNIFLLLDLHVSAILHYFEGDCLRYELYGENVLTKAIEELNLEKFVLGTADLGKTKWVETFADKFKTDIVFIRKTRVFKTTKVMDVIGDVAGKKVVIYDDMTRSGGTLIAAAEAYRQRGATEVYAVLSHLALSDETVIKKLVASPLKKIIATNSHPMSEHPRVKRTKKFIIKDVSGEFVSFIKKKLNEQ